MGNFNDEDKKHAVINILFILDNVNVNLQTPNYSKKYLDENYTLDVWETDEDYKRSLINSREQLRKILLTDWYQTEFTEEQITNITTTLSLVRQKITNIFTN
jgi:hypothetical protein